MTTNAATRWASTEGGTLRLGAVLTGATAVALSRPTASYSILVVPLLGASFAYLVSAVGFRRDRQRSLATFFTVGLGALLVTFICVAIAAVLYALLG
jgi:hypothetical protein